MQLKYKLRVICSRSSVRFVHSVAVRTTFKSRGMRAACSFTKLSIKNSHVKRRSALRSNKRTSMASEKV